jgi:hypothetical protein
MKAIEDKISKLPKWAQDEFAMLHRRLAEATAKNTRLRAALANSKDPCAYCSLAKNEWSKCVKGFPGCDRADDAMGCPELGARLEADEATARVERAEAALAEFERRTRATPVGAEDQTKGASIYNWRMACLAEIRELSGFVRYLPQDHPDHPAVRDAALPTTSDTLASTWNPPECEEIVEWWDRFVNEARNLTGKKYE